MKEMEFDFSKKEEYLQKEKLIPDYEAYLALQKFLLIEQLFALPEVDSVKISAGFDVENYAVHGGGYHFEASVIIDSDYVVSGDFDKESSPIQDKINLILKVIQDFDKEIIEHINEECLSCEDESDASSKAEEKMNLTLFLDNGEDFTFNRKDRFEKFRELSYYNYSKNSMPFFDDFLQHLKEDRLSSYITPTNSTYNIEFEIIPLNYSAIEKRYDVFDEKKQFNLYHNINQVIDFLSDGIKNKKISNTDNLYFKASHQQYESEIFISTSPLKTKSLQDFYIEGNAGYILNFTQKVTKALCNKYLQKNMDNFNDFTTSLSESVYANFEKKLISETIPKKTNIQNNKKRRI